MSDKYFNQDDSIYSIEDDTPRLFALCATAGDAELIVKLLNKHQSKLITEKICSKCKQLKPISEFNKDIRYACGHRSECKACKYTQTNGWRVRNADAVNGSARLRSKSETYLENTRMRQRRWRVAHPEKVKQAKRIANDKRRTRTRDAKAMELEAVKPIEQPQGKG